MIRGLSLAVVVGLFAALLAPVVSATTVDGDPGPHIIHAIIGIPVTAQEHHRGGFFGPVPEAIRQADSGLSFSYGLLHRHYVEQDGSGSLMDGERGYTNLFRLALDHQWGHWGLQGEAAYANGQTDYRGGIQSCVSGAGCTVTPSTGTTDNKIIDFGFRADYAFSPANHFAILPGVFVRRHVWIREINGPAGYSERYGNWIYGLELRAQYAIPLGRYGALVADLNGRYGRTLNPSMQTSINGQIPHTKFDLGSSVYAGIGGSLTWQVRSSIAFSISDIYDTFGYGRSTPTSVGGGFAVSEPRSRTQRNRLMFTVKVF